jgi:hypothetical protein
MPERFRVAESQPEDRPWPVPSEQTVVDLWQSQVRRGTVLQDLDGRPLQVVYPGRPNNDGRGGDFQDAVILCGGAARQGNIEVHTLTSGWQAHGHHRDPSYNRVILQVAWKADRGWPARSANGTTIPTVLIESPARSTSGPGLPCQLVVSGLLRSTLAALLESAGLQRFKLKSRLLAACLDDDDPRQVLYAALAGALGYTRNQLAFADFARRVPFSETHRNLGSPDLPGIEAYLLGRAALLPSQSRSAVARAGEYSLLESLWQQSGWVSLDPPPEWQFFRLRPANSPRLRMRVLAAWLAGGSLQNWQTQLVLPSSALCSTLAAAALESALLADLASSGCSSAVRPPGGSSLLGRSFAAVIVVNVLLPFWAAWAEKQGQTDLHEQSLALYCAYRPLESNALQRHMALQLGISQSGLLSACQQQGLIHIYKTCCIQGACNSCPLATA